MSTTNAQNLLGEILGESTRSMMGPNETEIGAKGRGRFTKMRVRFPWPSEDDPHDWLIGLVPGLETMAAAIAGEEGALGVSLKPQQRLAELKVTCRAPDQTTVVESVRAIPGPVTIWIDKAGGGHGELDLTLPLEDDARNRVIALERAETRWDFGATQLDVEHGDKAPRTIVRKNPNEEN